GPSRGGQDRAQGPRGPGLAQGRPAAREVPGRPDRRRRDGVALRARPAVDGRRLRQGGDRLMNKAWIVARHEFLTTGRRVWFVVVTFILPLVFAGIGFGMSRVAEHAVDESLATVRNKPMGYVDHWGGLAPHKEYVKFAGEQEAKE